MPSFKRAADFAIAAPIVIFAAAISPIGIRFWTGRLDLSPRVNIVSLTFDAFLLILAGAVLTSGRVRRVFFHLLACTIPLALLAAIEGGAVAVHLADRIAPLEDMSVLVNKRDWPPHLMSMGRKEVKDGLPLYRPWQGEGISINELGLRTAPPSPKKPGEWRIAVTGGSVAWGWRMRDADTIPVLLQQILHRQGHANFTVYNFAIDSITIAEELAVLKQLRKLYAIDHVVFFTGANDATDSYLTQAAPKDRLAGPLGGVSAFELIKVAGRLNAVLLGPSPSLVDRLDNEVLPKLAQHNSLRDGVIAADEYCRAMSISCDFILQPMLPTRREPRGSEIRIARTLNQVYPRYAEVIATIYRSTVNTGLPIHNRSDLFNDSAEPYFFDAAHVNEAGNRIAAEGIAAAIAATLR
jgi:lysophospholipase L1-like esterase